jgi:hypothetical protein
VKSPKAGGAALGCVSTLLTVLRLLLGSNALLISLPLAALPWCLRCCLRYLHLHCTALFAATTQRERQVRSLFPLT